MKTISARIFSIGLMVITILVVVMLWLFENKIIDNEHVAVKMVDEAGINYLPVNKLKSENNNEIFWDKGVGLFKTSKNQHYNGVYKSFYQSGQVKYIINFTNGKANGSVLVFGRRGKKRWEQTYVNGNPEGKWAKYDPFGVLQIEGKFKNGVKDSIWDLYYPDGNLRYRAEFSKGEKIKEWFYSNKN
jgi:antitoxin component YwqK of YwqJK toxin-antitoxin module